MNPNPSKPKLTLKMNLDQLIVVEDMLNEIPMRYSPLVRRVLDYMNQFVQEELPQTTDKKPK